MDKQLPVSAWPEWKIVEKIGEGSFGKVYKARRTEQGKTFYSAIKVITIPSNAGELSSVRSENPDEQSVKEYFYSLVEECIQEVNTMEYFRGNSHVVSVEDYKVMEYLDDIGWDIYIRMEYLTSFLDYCAGRALTEEDVIHLGIDLCKALEYCQCQNIIHRDIKPENIFVSRFGEFKLGDFGIARELDRTMSGLSKKGTFSYMAPEMYRGETYDARVDIYSLGIVLYKLRNHNRLPFISLKKQLITYRDKEEALNRRMAGEKLPVPAEAGEAFAEVILKACAYDRHDRYESAEEFRMALEQILYPGQPEMQEIRKDIRDLAHVRFAVIGDGTKKALEEHGIFCDFIPTAYSSKDMAEAMVPHIGKDESVLLLRAEEANRVLPDALEEAGISHTCISLYHTVTDERKADELNRLIKMADYVTFASSSAVRAFVSMVDNLDEVKGKYISIGPVTTKTAQENGLSIAKTAVVYTARGMVETMIQDAVEEGQK